MGTIGIISHGIAFIAFVSLTVMLLVSRRTNERSGSLILASALSALWALLATIQSVNPVLFWAFGGALDSIRILSWAYFLHSVTEKRVIAAASEAKNVAISDRDSIPGPPSMETTRFPLFIIILFIAHGGLWLGNKLGILSLASLVRFIGALWILVSITALFRLERFIRATPPEVRPSIRFLSIGLGAMFLFDFIVFTDAQLFSRINTDLWFARGFIYSLVVPLVALTIARNPQWSVSLHVSRQAVTTSITALAGGAYLLITGVSAYFVRFSGVKWASVAEVVVILVALLALALIALSPSLRSRLRVFVSKHLFNFKYDYRHEWLNFTDTLASRIGDTPDALLQGLTGLVDSDGGILWKASDQGRVDIIALRGSLTGDAICEVDAAEIQRFARQTQWLIDLDEVRRFPQQYAGMSLSNTLLKNDAAWLLLPLMFREELLAVLLFERSSVQKDINWEDRDLLKTAGRQAATLLKQEQTQEKLAEARQFQAFSKLSAYIVHDLKNIIGQQSLLVSNAAKHKHKPEFVDDVILTVDNSVKRMQALLEQLRSNRNEEQAANVNVVRTLESVVLNSANRTPVPTLKTSSSQVLVKAESDRLQRVFGHLVQNAQEATQADGHVSIDIGTSEGLANVTVSDTGCGMNPEFIRDKLFKAFESTKGLTGMGIGVFESREYVISLGGDMSVKSQAGNGTVFTVTLPLVTGDG